MELSSTLGGASSSSALSNHDVFLSFRGKDTRLEFTGNLYHDLVNKGLNVYMDDKKLRIGKIIRPALIQAIEESKSAIVILSENYANSKWCLDELAKIVECFETRELILYPIFYRVDPTDVRRQRNKFDLTKYKTDSEIAEDRMDSWRSALRKVGNFSGLHIKGNRYEIQDRDEIVRKISQELDLTLPIGLQETVRNLGSLIQSLTYREDDINCELVALERQQPRRKKKRAVVAHWLERMDTAKAEFESLQQEVGDVKFYSFSPGQLGKRVKRLTEEVASLNEESKFPDGITIDAYEARGVSFPTTGVVLGETFRMNCEEVLGYLKNDQVSSIGIYGMGGVGKTTVMKHVHNQILDDPTTFGDVCWVTVSQNLDICKLQKDIFRELNRALPSEDDENRARFLNDILKKGKYILILDDVWKEIPLEEVGIPVGVSLCKVIITTRSLDVCNEMACQQKIKISPLFQEEAWELFKNKLGSHEKLTSEVKETAKHVARRCGGLLLAIITMAASMREANGIHEWRNALEELKKPEISTINGLKEKILQKLECSYNHLGNDELKQCFLSCALYPEDFEIPRDELINYCIVKGLIQNANSRQGEIAKGRTILNKLVNCCLLERSRFNGEEDDEYVNMHDLIRVMALQNMNSKQQVMVKAGFLTKILEEEKWTKDLEVVSLIRNDIREIPDSMSPKCPKLSTLMLQWNFHLTQIPYSFFVELCGLHVLNLSNNWDLKVLPASVGELTNLIALWLCGCSSLTGIPSLRNLKKLRDLDLSNTEVKEIPDGIRELRSLRCLYMNNTKYQCPVEELMELQQLEEFRGCVRLRDASDYNVLVRSKWFQQLWAYRLFLSGLREEWSDWADDFFYTCGVENEVFLYELRLGGRGVVDVPHGIKRLVINWCHDIGKCLLEFGLQEKNERTIELKEIEIRGCKEVEWVGVGGGQSSFSKLKQLNIYKCDKMKVGLTVNCLEHLPVLEMLNIAFCSDMEEIIGRGEDRENSNSIKLPKLTNLFLHDLPSLRSVYHKGNIICDSIKEINLLGCTKLNMLPLTTTSCSEGSPRRPFPSLRKIYINRSEEEWWESLELVDPTYHPLLRPFLHIWE